MALDIQANPDIIWHTRGNSLIKIGSQLVKKRTTVCNICIIVYIDYTAR